MTADLPPTRVKIADMPKDAASAVGRATLNDRSPSGRIQGAEGQKVRLRQFARHVDSALRGLLAGVDIPLVLAALQPLGSIYRSVNSYAHLAPTGIDSSPDGMTDAELATRARSVLDGLYRDELADFARHFEARANQRRTTTDIVHAARPATYGAVETLLVDIDEDVPGKVSEVDGSVTFADMPSATSYGVVDEIAGRVIDAGGRVLGVRKADIPGHKPLAAVLRYPM